MPGHATAGNFTWISGPSQAQLELLEMARASSYTTHPGVIAAEACAFLA